MKYPVLPILRILLGLAFIFSYLESIGQLDNLKQDLRFENFSFQKKFVSGSVGNLIVDDKGYLWVCSDALYRFDGINVRKYSSLEQSGRGLKNNYCDDLLNDQYGRIWIGNLAGLCYYDSYRDSILYLDAGPGKPIKYAFSFVITDKLLWFVCNFGLCKLDLETLAITITSLREIKDPTGAYLISKDRLGISSRNAFYFYDVEKNSYTKKIFDINKTRVAINDVVKKGEVYWIATNLGLMTTTDFAELKPTVGVPPLYIRNLMFHNGDKSQKYLWMATNTGLYVANIDSQHIKYHYTHLALSPFSIPSNNVFRLFTDKNENIWIATEKGISLLQLGYQPFQTRFLSFDNNRTDNYIGLSAIDQFNPNNVWLACQHQGLIQLDWESKKIIKLHTSMNVPGGGLSISDMDQLDANRWLLLYPYSLVIWSKTSGFEKLAEWQPPYSPPSTVSFNRLIKTNGSYYYITSNQGLFQYNIKTNLLRQVLRRPELSNVHSSMDLIDGFVDDTGNLWIASRDGLVNYQTASGNVFVYKQDSLSGSNIDFLNDVKGDETYVYCGGINGLSRFNMISKNFSPLKFDGIISPNSFSLLVDGRRLWANTNAGLLMMDLETNRSHRFPIFGPSDAFSFSSISKIRNEVLIGYRDAFAYVDPLEVDSILPSKPIIENLFVNNRFFNLRQSDHSFHYWENNLRVFFTAFDYSNPSDIRFRYKLAGREEEWNYTFSERVINYVQLPPGSYELLIQAGNSFGWNENTTGLSFTIKPGFWQTWWFKLAVIAAIAWIIFSIIRLRIRNIRKAATIRQLMAETEMKALRAQMNPHFIFNCMATADGLILQNKKLEASDFLSKFSRLIRMVLENSMQSMISLEKDLAALELYLQLEQVRSQDSFIYRIKIDENLDTATTCIPPLLLQPFVENSILHGLRHLTNKRGQVIISISYSQDKLVCVIDDNGIGRKESRKINLDRNVNHQSIGLKVTETRIASMNLLYGNKQSVTIEDKLDNAGTIVTLSLPFLDNCH